MDDKDRRNGKLSISVCKEVMEKTDTTGEALGIYINLIISTIATAQGISIEEKLESCDDILMYIKHCVCEFHNSTDASPEQPTDVETTNPPNTNSPWAG